METERLILRPFAPEDEAAVLSGIADGELRRLYGLPAELSEGTACRIFAHFSALSTSYALQRKADGAVIGFLLDVPAELPADDALPPGGRTLAYATFPPYQRQGYMREALRALLDRYGQTRTAPFLHGGHFPDNGASQDLLRSLGFEAHGQHRQGASTIVDEILFL